MRTAPIRRADVPQVRRRIIHPGSVEFTVGALFSASHTGSWTGAVSWFSANDPIGLPFAISEACVVTQLGALNGTSPGGTFDIGVYDTSFNLIVSTGSTAGSGSQVLQWADVTNTAIAPGRYYLCMSRNDTTSQRMVHSGALTAAILAWAGVVESTTDSHPLPSTLSGMTATSTNTRVPAMAIALREPW